MAKIITIPTSTRALRDHLANADLRIVWTYRHREIRDDTALTVAGWWQSPNGHGETFAALASHLPVSSSDLLDACSAELSALADPLASTDDARALNCLMTWAVNYGEDTDDQT